MNPEETPLQKEVGKMFGTAENPSQGKPVVEDKGPLKSLRTYQGDMADTLSRTGASIASVAIAEQKKKVEVVEEAKKEETVTTKAEHGVFIYFGSIFLALGLITVGAVYFIRNYTAVAVPEQTTIIGYTEERKTPLDRNQNLLSNKIREASKTWNGPANSVLYLNIGTDKMEKVQDVLGILAPNMPPALLRSFEGPYMIGAYAFDTNEPFIILTTVDFGQSYAGMLKWEETMVGDMEGVFSIPPREGTTTPYVFEDETVRNKDLRVVKNNERKTILLYSFLDKNTLVITSNENIFNAILGKYIAGQLAR